MALQSRAEREQLGAAPRRGAASGATHRWG